jgi:hypothetical protein
MALAHTRQASHSHHWLSSPTAGPRHTSTGRQAVLAQSCRTATGTHGRTASLLNGRRLVEQPPCLKHLHRFNLCAKLWQIDP